MQTLWPRICNKEGIETNGSSLLEHMVGQTLTVTTKWSLQEYWRKVKKLGSLLGDEQDVIMRKTHANSALRSLKENWLKRKGLSTKTRIRLYNSLVKPILLYNAGTWGFSATDNDNLDSFHRDHLRRTLASKWHSRLSSRTVYVRTSSKPISLEITECRWRLFGHILRIDLDAPANAAMEDYFEAGGHRFRGRPRNNLPGTLDRDLKRTGKELKDGDDLDALRDVAQNRGKWNKLITRIVSCAAQALS
ncbi:uncharacterized protein LOC115227914 [Octopus sinensis]|uniref:Uncharacterized protein LOC115227914 n=1 Tax=Octopus sinensis TaxID=2607531 RepID=A0A6P7TRS8_9MOLL|nr:uncharacterized protein LOC115227914 [Octopus sinensis]